MQRKMLDVDVCLGAWMSAALEDKFVCSEMKQAIENWFTSFQTPTDKKESRFEPADYD